MKFKKFIQLCLFSAGLVLFFLLNLPTLVANATTTFTVSNTNDSGSGSLRQAILDSNSTSGSNIITFDIGSGSLAQITPNSPLPPITGPSVLKCLKLDSTINFPKIILNL